jgi:hypothetical protein
MAPSTPKPAFRIKIALIILSMITFFALLILFCLLAVDVFTIPYLTPLAHFLAIIISPFIPLIFPFYLSIFLKVCSYPKTLWPGQKKWIFITAAWGFSHTERVVRNTWKIWGGVIKGNGIEAVCGLEECRGKWVEEVLILLVVVAHIKGWKWDFGVGDKWVDSVIEQEEKKIEEARGKDAVQAMEKGEVIVGVDGGDEEKRELMVRDEIMSGGEEKEDLLIETEEKIIVQSAEEVKA